LQPAAGADPPARAGARQEQARGRREHAGGREAGEARRDQPQARRAQPAARRREEEMLRRRLLALLALAALATRAGAELPKELNFGILATESAQSLRAAWQPLLDDLQSRSGIRINAFFASDYAGVIEAMRFGKVQLAWMGNKSGMEA